MRYNSATFTLGGIGWLYIFRSSELLLGYKKAIVIVNHSAGEGGGMRESQINVLFSCNQLMSSPNET